MEKIEREGGKVVEAHLRVGLPEVGIVDLAEELGAGLVVLGSRGLGPLKRAVMGSVSDSVVRHAHCPVLVVREKEFVGERTRDRDSAGREEHTPAVRAG